jgi:hypothetical protein
MSSVLKHLGLPTSEQRNSGRRTLDSLPPFPRRTEQYVKPERAVGHISKIFNASTSWKIKKKNLNILHFSDLAPIQIHNHVYSPADVYSEKAGYKYKWHKLHFTQQQRTTMYLNVVSYIKL